jgi:DNA-directed RNA polymerase subunit RPC12/RpoP
MKIVKPSEKGPWWIGQRARCDACGTVVEIEADDDKELLLKSSNVVVLRCPTCSSSIDVEKGHPQMARDVSASLDMTEKEN